MPLFGGRARRAFDDALYKLTNLGVSESESDDDDLNDLHHRGIYHYETAYSPYGGYNSYGGAYHTTYDTTKHGYQYTDPDRRKKKSTYTAGKPRKSTGYYKRKEEKHETEEFMRKRYHKMTQKRHKGGQSGYCAQFFLSFVCIVVTAVLFLFPIKILGRNKGKSDIVWRPEQLPERNRSGVIALSDSVDCSVAVKHAFMTLNKPIPSILGGIACLHQAEPHNVGKESSIVASLVQYSHGIIETGTAQDTIMRNDNNCRKENVFSNFIVDLSGDRRNLVKHMCPLADLTQSVHNYLTRKGKNPRKFPMTEQAVERLVKSMHPAMKNKYQKSMNTKGKNQKFFEWPDAHIPSYHFTPKELDAVKPTFDGSIGDKMGRQTRMLLYPRTQVVVPAGLSMSLVSAFVYHYIEHRIINSNLVYTSKMAALELETRFYEYSMKGQAWAYHYLFEELVASKGNFSLFNGEKFVKMAISASDDLPNQPVIIDNLHRVSSTLNWFRDNGIGTHTLSMISLGLKSEFCSEEVDSTFYEDCKKTKVVFRRGKESIAVDFSAASQITLLKVLESEHETIPTGAVTCSGSIRNAEAVSTIASRMRLMHEPPGVANMAASAFYDVRDGKFYCEHFHRRAKANDAQSHESNIFGDIEARTKGTLKCSRIPLEWITKDRIAMAIWIPNEENLEARASIDPRYDYFNYEVGY